MGKYSVVGTEVPKVMRHVARCTKGKHLGMHVQSKLQQLLPSLLLLKQYTKMLSSRGESPFLATDLFFYRI
jgi:hypothetical protein